MNQNFDSKKYIIMIQPEDGILLVADPFLKDPNFMRSVVLLCRHNINEGSFGFSLNRELDQTLDEFLPGFENFPYKVFLGGPVQVDTIHYLHKYPDLIAGSREVIDGIYWGGDFEMMKKFLNDGLIEENNIKFFLGYSGWEAGQLDNEIKEGTWLTVKGNRKIAFDVPADEAWRAGVKLLGSDYEMMINFPIDPQLN